MIPFLWQVRTVGADGWESPPGQAGWSAPLICEDLNSLDPNELLEPLLEHFTIDVVCNKHKKFCR